MILKAEDKKVVEKKDSSKKNDELKEDGRRTISIPELYCRACNSRQVYTLKNGTQVCRKCSFRDESTIFEDYIEKTK